MSCPPRYATSRRPERESFGHELAAIAAKLGQPFMPWQRYVADVGCEIDPSTGRPAYREVRVTIPRQSGKALDVATPILTYNRGWTTMGGLRRGDAVFHPDGFPVAVTFVSDVMEGHDCFRVTTVDGRSVVADADHLWQVTDKRLERSRGTRRVRKTWFEQRVVTTRDMINGGLSRYASGGRTSRTDGKSYVTNEYRWVLPQQEPLKSPDVDLPIDPYLLGAWLGDGHSHGGRLTCHVDEVPHWSAAIKTAGFIPTARQGGGTINTWCLGITTSLGLGRKARSFSAALRRLNLINNKHVPALYLAAGFAQREAILQGLLDTDGTIDGNRGQIEFCSISRGLAEDVLFLARSLGWRATLRVGRATLNGRDCGPKYRVGFTPKRTDPAAPFRMLRKAAKVQEHDGGKGRNTLSVSSIEPVPSVPVRCIKVDAPDGLFLAGRDLIPTHNTSLFLSWQINRCVSRRWKHPQRSAFTAQTGKDARDKWIDELFPLIRNSALKGLVSQKGSRLEINEGMGNEAIRFRTGSLIRLLSTSTSSGHSKTLHQAVMDEVWHDTDDRREQGLRPAMITVPDAQLLVCSTAGTETSTVLNRKVETGRQAVLEDTGYGVAYFEWSALEDWDPEDEESYFSFSPALCPAPPCRCAPPGEGWRHTITLEALRAEREAMELPEFMRAYGNIASGLKKSRWLVIPESDWSDAGRDLNSTALDPVAFAVTVSRDRDWANIAAAGAREDGLRHVELMDRRPGTGWVVERLVELVARWKPCAVVIDPGTPAGSLVASAEEAGLTLTKPTVRDVVAGAGAFYDGISGKRAADPETGELGPDPRVIRHRGQGELTNAVAAARKRPLGTAWAWDQLAGTEDMSALLAASNALWGYSTRPPVEDAVPLVSWR